MDSPTDIECTMKFVITKPTNSDAKVSENYRQRLLYIKAENVLPKDPSRSTDKLT